jgi:hypothetical protein
MRIIYKKKCKRQKQKCLPIRQDNILFTPGNITCSSFVFETNSLCKSGCKEVQSFPFQGIYKFGSQDKICKQKCLELIKVSQPSLKLFYRKNIFSIYLARFGIQIYFLRGNYWFVGWHRGWRSSHCRRQLFRRARWRRRCCDRGSANRHQVIDWRKLRTSGMQLEIYKKILLTIFIDQSAFSLPVVG